MLQIRNGTDHTITSAAIFFVVTYAEHREPDLEFYDSDYAPNFVWNYQ